MSSTKPFGEMIFKDFKGQPIFAKTHGQYELVKTIEKNEITFVNGVAGTGKTFLASVLAAKYYKEGIFNKIVLTRPVVEAGESMGFLPGTAEEKVAFYMKPLYEYLTLLLKSNRNNVNNNSESPDGKKPKRKREVRREENHKPATNATGVINISEAITVEPLAYMRGTTFKDTIIIADEFQNTTPSQMKMFLTRIGDNCKMIITGDVNQCDLKLKHGVINGMEDAMRRLTDIENIGMVDLTYNDVVRNKIIKDILRAYDVGRVD